MKYAICCLAAAPVRKEPSHRSEMVNQILFGETMEVLERREEWIFIKSTFDQYEGWLTDHFISLLEGDLPNQEYVTSEIINIVELNNIPTYIPMASSLTGFNPDTRKLWNESFQFNNNSFLKAKPFNMESFEKTLNSWLNVPYLWGGRTLMGVDCSGFVQNIFKMGGIVLHRDAYLQESQGIIVNNLENVMPGDLAFFHNQSGKVIHVGIILNDGKIIHSSGKVRIDTFNENGIINSETGLKTHEFHSVKSFGLVDLIE